MVVLCSPELKKEQLTEWPGSSGNAFCVPYGGSEHWTRSWLSRRCVCKTGLQLVLLSKILRSWYSQRTQLWFLSCLPFLSPSHCLFPLLTHVHRQLILFSILGREALASCLVVFSCSWTTFSHSSFWHMEILTQYSWNFTLYIYEPNP